MFSRLCQSLESPEVVCSSTPAHHWVISQSPPGRFRRGPRRVGVGEAEVKRMDFLFSAPSAAETNKGLKWRGVVGVRRGSRIGPDGRE